MTNPTFSVITVTLNCREDALLTARSVWSQQGADYDYVVKDGGSEDGTPEAIRDGGRAQLQVAPGKGIYDAMNQAIERARGGYIHFLNAGDTYTHSRSLDRLALVTAAASKPELVVCFAEAMSSGQTLVCPEKPSRLFLYRRGLCHQAVFFRRDLFERFGHFDTTLTLRADQDFIHRCIVGGRCSLAVVPEGLVTYKGGGASDGRGAINKLDLERMVVARRHFGLLTRTTFQLLHEASLWRLRRWLLQVAPTSRRRVLYNQFCLASRICG
jgi:putative colanic acid biosynthesis glycosyltransferase